MVAVDDYVQSGTRTILQYDLTNGDAHDWQKEADRWCATSMDASRTCRCGYLLVD